MPLELFGWPAGRFFQAESQGFKSPRPLFVEPNLLNDKVLRHGSSIEAVFNIQQNVVGSAHTSNANQAGFADANRLEPNSTARFRPG